MCERNGSLAAPLPGSIRVACASDDGEVLDGHFGSCRRFLIYEVSAAESRLVGVREVDDAEAEDKSAYRAALIADCSLLYVAATGGSAASKVVNVSTNLAALCWFVPVGAIMVKVAALMALANLAGAWVGAHLAMKNGALFVRRVFIVVVSVLIARLTWDVLS